MIVLGFLCYDGEYWYVNFKKFDQLNKYQQVGLKWFEEKRLIRYGVDGVAKSSELLRRYGSNSNDTILVADISTYGTGKNFPATDTLIRVPIKDSSIEAQLQGRVTRTCGFKNTVLKKMHDASYVILKTEHIVLEIKTGDKKDNRVKNFD